MSSVNTGMNFNIEHAMEMKTLRPYLMIWALIDIVAVE
jgi:hypothetical protein